MLPAEGPVSVVPNFAERYSEVAARLHPLAGHADRTVPIQDTHQDML